MSGRAAMYGVLRKGGVRPWFFVLVLALGSGCSGENERKAAEKEIGPKEEIRPLTVTAAVDRARVEVGETVKYSVMVSAAKGITPELPACLENVPVFLDHGPWERTTREDGRLEAKKWVTVDPGIGPYCTFAPAVIRFKDKDGNPGEASSEEISVEVKSRLAAGEAIPDIRERVDSVALPPRVEPADRRWLVIAGIVGGGLLLAGIAILVYVKVAKKKLPPPRPPWIVALEEIAAVRGAGLLETGAVEEFYVRLSGSVRRYIEKRFGIMAPEMTTEEFLFEAKRSAALLPGQRDLLTEFLLASDLVKFAKYTPEATEAEGALVAAERFVRDSSGSGIPAIREGAASVPPKMGVAP